MMLQSEGLKLDPLATLTYLAPCTAVVLLPIVVLVEGPKLQAASSESLVHVPHLLFFSCSAAALINVVIFEFIGATSALTANLSGVLKDVVIIVIAATVQGVPITLLQVAGYSLALCGLWMYQYEKIIMQAPRDKDACVKEPSCTNNADRRM